MVMVDDGNFVDTIIFRFRFSLFTVKTKTGNVIWNIVFSVLELEFTKMNMMTELFVACG